MGEQDNFKYMVAARCMTYNQAAYIEDTLHGFAIQETTFPVVYIIVDDASTDDEPNVIKRWASRNLSSNGGSIWSDVPYGSLAVAPLKDKPNQLFVFLLLHENHYQSGNGKRRLEYIAEWCDNAKYHAICEGDDYWIHPMKLQKQVVFMEENSDAGIIHTDCSSYNESTGSFHHFINRKETINSSIDTTKSKDNIVQYYKGELNIRFCTVLIRASTMTMIRNADPFLFDGHLSLGDSQTWVGCLLLGKRILYMDEETAVYRIHEGSASRATSYKEKLKFALSRYEIRLYYQRKYDILQEFPETERMYYRYLRLYRLLYNPTTVDLDGRDRDPSLFFRQLSRNKFVRHIIVWLISIKNMKK